MSLTSDQLETYRRDGVLPLGRILSADTVREALEHLEALRARQLMDQPIDRRDRKSFRLLNVSQHDAWFERLIRHDTLLDMAAAALGPDIQFFQDNVFYKPPRDGGATEWHQDNIWWNASPPHMLTIWIALDDVDTGNGALRYVRGSHGHLIEPQLPSTTSTG